MTTPFIKMHGCGNDFVIFDERTGSLGLTPARAAAIADRNPDGGEAGACGNATRCVARLLADELGRDSLVIQTISGLLACIALPDGRVAVDMGRPRMGWQDVPLAGRADTLRLEFGIGALSGPAAVSMGNPHATFFVDDIDALDIPAIGPKLENAEIFPDRANIGFAQVLAPDHIRLRVWERGAGLTLACGSGACATIVNAARRGLTGRHARVDVDGGVLDMTWRDDDHVVMTGPTTLAFRGQIDLSGLPS